MHDFVFKEIKDADIAYELSNIGFDASYVHKAVDKFLYKNIKLFELTIAQANILKQTALSVGADCATHRETITGKIDKSDCILGGSVSQFRKIAEKLKFQPFGLKALGESLLRYLETFYNEYSPKIVGILNITENSFSDGGMYNNFDSAKKHLMELISDGADIIDMGAESTKPYSSPVSPDVQLRKLLPLVEFAAGKVVVSVDTRSSLVAQECIRAGAKIINDVSGFDFDSEMVKIIAKYGVKVIIQHSVGAPDSMQENHFDGNFIDEIFLSLKNKVEFAISNGVEKNNIIIDPGIGFGKTREQNFEIIKRVDEFYSIGCPVMLGVSRKSLLAMPDADNYYKDIFTVALNTLAFEKKVDYYRVHNVKLHTELLQLMRSF